MTDALIALTLVAMVGAALLSIVPVLPAAVLVWAIAIVYAAVTNFERMTPAAAIAITAMMVAAATSDLWLRLFGARGQSCLSAVGSFVGAILGTFLIPIPVIGTLIGSILGAVLVEMARIRELRRALQSGQIAFQQFLAGMIVNIVISFSMIGIFILSVWTTA
jgi:uncharacterized protein YqgC (DUF456 family)